MRDRARKPESTISLDRARKPESTIPNGRTNPPELTWGEKVRPNMKEYQER